MAVLKKKIILIRHGRTDFNEADILQGRIDCPLNANGERDAASIADYLKNEPVERIFSSPLLRAQQTAAIFNAQRQVPVEFIPAFMEINLGEWEGLEYTRVKVEFAAAHNAWITDIDAAAPAGESYHALFVRVGPGVQQVLASSATVVAIVGHAMVNRAILGNLVGLAIEPSRRFHVDHGAYSTLFVHENNGVMYTVVDRWNASPSSGGVA